MASEEKRELLKAIAPTLKAHGFKKKSATWYRTRDGFIQTFNVQGSQWSKAFYLNLGIYIKAIGDSTTPPEFDCHIRNRVGDLVEDLDRYNQLLDFENDLTADERSRELNEIIEARAFPWFDEFSNNQKIIDWITGEQSHGLPILKVVYEHFGVEQRAGRTTR
ncbi:DUF4304 domain-containing protein [Roseiconus lacunae]|uniref:DUF4304 domain-containing protein n=1 Tax=Roseiconus lacunae TaxID=2605694 RepID=A0ABT7PSB4_9BACT|nr:DUF4304 domain-containing protein [Roseiconus lacunae]MDM4019382.1 DUF4304 domain-containing protein [Roseiconus lacunae]